MSTDKLYQTPFKNALARLQEGDLNQLIWNVPDTIAYLSTLFLLEPGDLIFSGTPAGVAAVKQGDVLKGQVVGLPDLIVRIV